MSLAAHRRKIDELTNAAARALAGGDAFESERAALEAISLARREREFERMVRNIATLEQSRRQRVREAAAAGSVTILDTPFADDLSIGPGCYLVQPPLVGADARRLRLMAFARKVPTAILCREPLTRVGLMPVVAISADATVRGRIDPPEDPDHPDLEWFLEAIAALGDAAIDGIDPELEIEKRIDALSARVDAVPEHEELHHCFEQACLEAEERKDSTADVEP